MCKQNHADVQRLETLDVGRLHGFAQTSNGVKKLLSQIISAILGLWIASLYIPGFRVALYGDSSFFGFLITNYWQLFILLGLILGLLNFFVKPILDALTLPLRIVTLGFFSFASNMLLIFIVDIMFKELYIPFWLPLLYASFIIWGLCIIISTFFLKETK